VIVVIRRFLVLAAFLFWQGGFTFYGAVVVPTGKEVLGSHLEQGFITRRVTNYLNLAGAVALVIIAGDIALMRPRTLGWWLCMMTWAGMAASLAVLIWLHERLEMLLDPHAMRLLDRDLFRTEHRWYLVVSTCQWICALAYMLLVLHLWRRHDQCQA